MRQRTGTEVDIAWLVNDLVSRVAHVQHAVVLSQDGLPIANSAELNREDAEHLSAVAAGVHGLARGAGRRFRRGTYGRASSKWSRASCSSPPVAMARAWPC